MKTRENRERSHHLIMFEIIPLEFARQKYEN
jgi:hypothetical protein